MSGLGSRWSISLGYYLEPRYALKVLKVVCHQRDRVADSTGCNPEIICRNDTSSFQAELDLAKFPAELQIVRNDDGGLNMSFEGCDSFRLPFSLHCPEKKLANGDERQRDGLPFDMRAIEIGSRVALLIQEGKNVSVK